MRPSAPITWVALLSLCTACGDAGVGGGRPQWTPERAAAWYQAQPWLVGANFIPSTASNQLEMWQAATFDEATIDRELGWAASLGFNTARVFLHDLAWSQDPGGFLDRVDRFLAIAARHGIRPMLVLFDGVWDPFPRPGRQPEPRPGVHNSRWLQSPGAETLGEPSRHDELRPYVEAVIGRFRADPRVLVWDLFNEPDNPNPAYAEVELPADAKARDAEALLRKTFAWARGAGPAQPLTAGVWVGDWSEPEALSPLNRLMLTESDVVTFHSYEPAPGVRARLAALRQYGRPILCTEYMARPVGSRFETILPVFAEERVGAYNWGLVSGRTQTTYSWLSWLRPDPPGSEWFHDILHPDGTPYREDEAALIRSLTSR